MKGKGKQTNKQNSYLLKNHVEKEIDLIGMLLIALPPFYDFRSNFPHRKPANRTQFKKINLKSLES